MMDDPAQGIQSGDLSRLEKWILAFWWLVILSALFSSVYFFIRMALAA
jgi:hypothetical protein